MRILLLVLASCAMCVVAPQALAQDGDEAIRAALAERLIDATVREGMDKMMDDVIERQMAAASNLTDEQRAWNIANVPQIFEPHLTAMIDDMERRYAETFTAAELRALVGFYETPAGRIIAAKQNEVGTYQGEQMVAFMQAYIADYRAKYCAAFGCPGQSPDAAGLNKH